MSKNVTAVKVLLEQALRHLFGAVFAHWQEFGSPQLSWFAQGHLHWSHTRIHPFPLPLPEFFCAFIIFTMLSLSQVPYLCFTPSSSYSTGLGRDRALPSNILKFTVPRGCNEVVSRVHTSIPEALWAV